MGGVWSGGSADNHWDQGALDRQNAAIAADKANKAAEAKKIADAAAAAKAASEAAVAKSAQDIADKQAWDLKLGKGKKKRAGGSARTDYHTGLGEAQQADIAGKTLLGM